MVTTVQPPEALDPPASTSEPAVGQDPSACESPLNQGERRRVLLAEDDPALCLALRTRLATAGYDVVSVHDGWAALEFAEEHAPDVLVIDLGLPGLGGLSVVKRVLESLATWYLPIIVITGDDSENVQTFAREMGVKEVLHKPLDAKDLLLSVERALTDDPFLE